MQNYKVYLKDNRINAPLKPIIVEAPDRYTAITYAKARACGDAGLPFTLHTFSALAVEIMDVPADQLVVS